jgi:hypothetical protein
VRNAIAKSLNRKGGGQRLTFTRESAKLLPVMRVYLVLLSIVLSVGSCRAQDSAGKAAPPVPRSEPAALEFSDQDAERILQLLKQGAESHNLQQILSAFDPERTDGYLTLEGQADEFVRKYDPVRFYFRILQTSTNDRKGIAMVEIQMQAEPRDSNGVAVRRDQQFRFEFASVNKAWKITALAPARLFVP